jgi:2',3'-cyclic-nucleotide 2'-phosphodiesterase/3'-nucleotidase
MAVGNHEFDFGLERLQRTRAAATFPWLAANVTRDGAPAFGTSLVKTLGGVRVGIIGLTTPAVPWFEDSALVAGLEFGSPVEAARREAARLRDAERCDVVVLLAHTGLEADPATGIERKGDTPGENWGARLARDVPGVDLVILAHTHAVVPWLRVGGTLVTQAGKQGEALGRVDLTLTREAAADRWRLASSRADVIAVADSTPADSAIVALARPYHAAARGALDEVVGEAAREIGSPRGRFDDGPLWELIQQAQLAASGAEVSLAALPDPAARIARGPIRTRDVLRAYPYENTLEVVELSGAELKDVLERSASYLAGYTYEHGRPLAEPGMPGYNFDAAEGVGYEIDLTRPPGERIANLVFHGAPIPPDRRLRVAVNSYRANGGGGYEVLRNAPKVWRSTATVPELIADYVRRAKTLDGGFTRGWTLLPDYASTPERSLIDLLVRRGVAPRAEVYRLGADEPARRGDLAYWIARAYGWRETRRSGAFADVPDSLEPWLDGLLRRRVLGEAGTLERMRPFAVAPLSVALDWCESAARRERYALGARPDIAFRRGLLSGTSLGPGPAGREFLRDTLSRAQVLGLVANVRFPTLRVLETTDFHGAILPGATERRTRRPFGGSAVLAAHIEKLRGENPEGTLLLDGGDCFQGTMISNLQFGRPVVEQMNALRYAAMAIGNHEFDWTADTLARRVRGMKFAALGANMIQRSNGRRPGWVRADTLLVRRGVRVGVLGLCYRSTPSVTLAANVAHLRFTDDSAAAARLVPQLRRRGGAEVVIGLGHLPAESDSARHATGGDLPRLARGVRGVDAWFGGHSHNLVLDEANGVPFLIAGALGQAVAVCDLVVDPVANRVVERRPRLQLTYADEVTPDSAMAARVARWNAGVAPVAAAAVGRNARRLTRGSPESTVGDFVADAMREAVGADAALQNSGGLRAELAEGVITRGAIYEVMPFDNTIFTMELTGAELKRALEDGLRSGRVTQVSGIRFTFDPDRPSGQRVLSLARADGTPIDEARLYKVACNNFMATGGDSYDALAGGKNRADTGRTVRDAMEALVIARSKRGGALDYAVDGRIQRVSAGK